jgi:hypothetical protein
MWKFRECGEGVDWAGDADRTAKNGRVFMLNDKKSVGQMSDSSHGSTVPGEQYVALVSYLAGERGGVHSANPAIGFGPQGKQQGDGRIIEELRIAKIEAEKWRDCARELASTIDHLHPNLRDERGGFTLERSALAKFDMLQEEEDRRGEP